MGRKGSEEGNEDLDLHDIIINRLSMKMHNLESCFVRSKNAVLV
jgi:hypothetical protein